MLFFLNARQYKEIPKNVIACERKSCALAANWMHGNKNYWPSVIHSRFNTDHATREKKKNTPKNKRKKKTWMWICATAEYGLSGVPTLAETSRPVSGSRQTTLTITFSLWQAVVSKSFCVQGLAISRPCPWIDRTQDVNFCKKRTRSSVYCAHISLFLVADFGIHPFAWWFFF